VSFGRKKPHKSKPKGPDTGVTIDEVIEDVIAAHGKEQAEAPARLPMEPAPEIEGNIMVVVSNNGEKAMEVSSFTGVKEAQSFIEGLLADGTDRSAVAAFLATPLGMKVAYRPIVSLPLDPGQQEAEQS
jgi:hypothetical protein